MSKQIIFLGYLFPSKIGYDSKLFSKFCRQKNQFKYINYLLKLGTGKGYEFRNFTGEYLFTKNYINTYKKLASKNIKNEPNIKLRSTRNCSEIKFAYLFKQIRHISINY